MIIKKIILIISLLMVSNPLLAKEKKALLEMNISCEQKVKPDIIKVLFKLEHKDHDFAKVYDKISKYSKEFEQEFKRKFPKIKIANTSINTREHQEYEGRKREKVIHYFKGTSIYEITYDIDKDKRYIDKSLSSLKSYKGGASVGNVKFDVSEDVREREEFNCIAKALDKGNNRVQKLKSKGYLVGKKFIKKYEIKNFYLQNNFRERVGHMMLKTSGSESSSNGFGSNLPEIKIKGEVKLFLYE